MEARRSFPLHFLDGGLFAFVDSCRGVTHCICRHNLVRPRSSPCHKFHFLTEEKGAQRSQVFHPKSHSENDQEPEFKSRFGILQRASLPPPLPKLVVT